MSKENTVAAPAPNVPGGDTNPSANAADQQVYSATNLEMHTWALGKWAYYFMYMPMQWTNMFITELGLNPQCLGIIYALPRLIDGLIDPLLGHWSDITHTRWGRRRPFILGTALLGCSLMAAIWWVSPNWGHWFTAHPPAGPHWLNAWWLRRDWPHTLMYVYIGTIITCLYISFGTYEMNHNALGFELSDDYNIRTKVFAIGGFWMSLVTSIIGGAIWPLALSVKFQRRFGGFQNSMRAITGALALLGFCAALVVFLRCRERFAKANRKHVPLWPALKATITNRPFIVLLILGMSTGLSNLYNAVSFYIAWLYVFQGNKAFQLKLNFIGGLIGLGVATLLVPLAAPLTRRFGKRQGIIIGAAVGLVNSALLPFVARPGHPFLWWGFGLAFMPITAFIGLLNQSLLPDICDLDELRYGERREGLFSAVWTFFGKLQMSLFAIVGMWLLTWSGYKEALKEHQSPATVHRMLWIGFTPNILFHITTLVIVCFIPITPQLMARVRAELTARKAAAAQAALG